MIYDSTPSTRQIVKFATAITIGAGLLLLAGLTLTGTIMGLVVATPVLVIFSPVLVPAAITVFLIISGFLFSGGSGIAAVSVFTWIYNYITGKHPLGAGPIDTTRNLITGAAKSTADTLKDALPSTGQQKNQEAYRASS